MTSLFSKICGFPFLEP